jgi:molecular chaperone DnaK (HSP70)
LIDDFLKKTGINIHDDYIAYRNLKKEVEWAKKKLSMQEHTIISIDNLINGIEFRTKITRSLFEELCFDIFKKMELKL